jgi:hypothetical protein
MGFSGFSGFLRQKNWLSLYYWNIVESGVKHHNRNLNPLKVQFVLDLIIFAIICFLYL